MPNEDAPSELDSRVFWLHLLEQCQENLGPVPRQFSFLQKLRLFRVLPSWAYFDPIWKTEKRRMELFQKGVVVWGHTVQANNTLFRNGFSDAPGEVIFCTYPAAEVNPQYLSSIARKLFEGRMDSHYSGSDIEIINHLRNQYTRAKGLQVDSEKRYELMLSSVMFYRKDLPGNMLALSFFPVLVLYDGTVTVLPQQYWPKWLVEYWNESRYSDMGRFFRQARLVFERIFVAFIQLILIVALLLFAMMIFVLVSRR